MSRFATGIVVVGGSAAGLSAADGLREGGYDGAITVLDDNLGPGFDRPMLSKGLLGADGATPVLLRMPEWLAAQDVTVLSGHRAMGLDIDRRLVVTSYGEAIPYDQVVIASGVGARRLTTTAGNRLPTLRTLADLETVRAMVARHRSLTIVGGGYVGLEVAAALRARDVDVTVLCPQALPLEQTVGAPVAGWLRDLHTRRGVRLELGVAVSAVDETPDGYVLQLSDGRRTEASAVLAGVGTEPATDWLIGSGVELDGGVLADDAGRTNVPGVWAAGDVVATADPATGTTRRSEHWTHAIEHGRHVGLNIARGEATPYAAVPYVWTEQHGHTLHLLGERQPGDTDVLVDGDLAAGDFVVAHAAGDTLHAVTVCGRPQALRRFRKLLRSGATLDQARAAVPA
jgi:3-phenylpropionate/trans-cinnamate dioxygenase ferredoxin reductase component